MLGMKTQLGSLAAKRELEALRIICNGNDEHRLDYPDYHVLGKMDLTEIYHLRTIESDLCEYGFITIEKRGEGWHYYTITDKGRELI